MQTINPHYLNDIDHVTASTPRMEADVSRSLACPQPAAWNEMLRQQVARTAAVAAEEAAVAEQLEARLAVTRPPPSGEYAAHVGRHSGAQSPRYMPEGSPKLQVLSRPVNTSTATCRTSFGTRKSVRLPAGLRCLTWGATWTARAQRGALAAAGGRPPQICRQSSQLLARSYNNNNQNHTV